MVAYHYDDDDASVRCLFKNSVGPKNRELNKLHAAIIYDKSYCCHTETVFYRYISVYVVFQKVYLFIYLFRNCSALYNTSYTV